MGRSLHTSGDGPWLVLGAGAAAAAGAACALAGPIVLAAIAGLVAFGALCWGFARVPHVMAAGLIGFLAVQPTLLLFVSSSFGPAKDLVVGAAVLGTAYAIAERRETRIDAWLLAGVLLLLAVYFVNPAGRHDAAWANASRLVAEALALLLVGVASPNPMRTWRWAVGALLAVGLGEVGLGLVQRGLGIEVLVDRLGYTYGAEVRETNGLFRAFGTFQEPFSYAAFLLFALAAALTAVRSARWSAVLTVVLVVGIAGSVVRTAAVLVAMMLAVGLARRDRLLSAIAVALAVLLSAGTYVALAPQTENVSPVDFILTLNGRTESWTALITTPEAWVGGRGVGDVGVGARRAAGAGATVVVGGAVQQSSVSSFRRFNVDSSYLATVADVGLTGIAVLFAILFRIAALAWPATRRGSPPAWMALGMLATMLADALTRSSLTSFPTGFIGLYVIGLSLGAAGQPDHAGHRATMPRSPRRDRS